MESLYAFESYARDNHLSHDERHKFRNEKAPPILDELKSWLTSNITKLPKQHQIGKALYYVLNNWEGVTSYLKDGRLEIDNNKIENLIRPLALGRRIFYLWDRLMVLKPAILYSLIATCTVNNLEPYKYFLYDASSNSFLQIGGGLS